MRPNVYTHQTNDIEAVVGGTTRIGGCDYERRREDCMATRALRP